MSSEEQIKEINSLRDRIKRAEAASIAVGLKTETAQADLDAAYEEVKALGVDASNPKALADWIDGQVEEIEGIIKKAEINIRKAAEMLDG